MTDETYEAELRLLEVGEKVRKQLEKLDPKDQDYGKKVEALAKMYDAAIEDFKAHSESDVANLKLETEADIEHAKNATDEAKNKETERANRQSEWLAKLKIGATVFVGVLTAGTNIWAFKRSTRKEDDEAYLTTTDKVTASEGLRKGFFHFGRNNEF